MSREAKVPHIGNGSLQVGVTVPLPSGNATHIRASSGPPRTPLSEAEIDAINLGGAEQGVAPKKKKATG